MRNKGLKYTALITIICILNMFSAGCSSVRIQEIPVLMYHHFDDNETSSMVVKVSEFEKQMKYLKDNNFNTITIQDLIDFKKGKIDLPDKSVLITSDDGYLSNYEFMYPILKENEMKATISVIGKSIDNAEENIKNGSEIPKFNWEQAKEMYDSGVIDFQGHTYDSHYKVSTPQAEISAFATPFNDESEEDYRKRIDEDTKKSIQGFEDNLGYRPTAFIYPYGEFSTISEEVLKENGIDLSFIVGYGNVSNEDENTYLLNRMGIYGEDNLDTFIEKVNYKS